MAGLMTPLDGRITSQNILLGPLTGGEVQEIVSPGNASLGNTYQVTLLTLAAFFAAFPALNTEIVTAGSIYNVQATDTRVLFNKTIGSPTSVVFPLVNSMIYQQPVLIKDIKGDAFTNNISITFSGGQLCDGQPLVTLGNNYDFTWINPIPGGSGWYQT